MSAPAVTIHEMHDLVKTPRPTHVVLIDGRVVAVCFTAIHAQVLAKLLQEWVVKPVEESQ